MEESVVTEIIEFVGLSEAGVDEKTEAEIKEITQHCMDKIKPVINRDLYLKVHVKQQFATEKDKKHLYSIIMHLAYPGSLISTDNAEDWDIKMAMHKATKELEHRIEHIFKV